MRYTLFLVISLLLIGNIGSANQNGKFNLRKDLGIGGGEEPYVFGEISELEIDSKGNIYVLDTPFIKKFDKNGNFLLSIGGKGEGPGEFPSISILYIALDSKGKLFVLNGLKGDVSVFNKKGEFLYSIKTGVRSNGILIDSEDNVVIVGFKDNKIFHVYSQKGDFISSFGESFNVPKKYEKC